MKAKAYGPVSFYLSIIDNGQAAIINRKLC